MITSVPDADCSAGELLFILKNIVCLCFVLGPPAGATANGSPFQTGYEEVTWQEPQSAAVSLTCGTTFIVFQI